MARCRRARCGGCSAGLTVNSFTAGAAFNRDTTLDLTATLDPSVGGKPHGVFSPATITMPAGVSSQVFSISYTAADNGVC